MYCTGNEMVANDIINLWSFLAVEVRTKVDGWPPIQRDIRIISCLTLAKNYHNHWLMQSAVDRIGFFFPLFSLLSWQMVQSVAAGASKKSELSTITVMRLKHLAFSSKGAQPPPLTKVGLFCQTYGSSRWNLVVDMVAPPVQKPNSMHLALHVAQLVLAPLTLTHQAGLQRPLELWKVSLCTRSIVDCPHCHCNGTSPTWMLILLLSSQHTMNSIHDKLWTCPTSSWAFQAPWLTFSQFWTRIGVMLDNLGQDDKSTWMSFAY